MIANGEVHRLLVTFLQAWSARKDTANLCNVWLDPEREDEVDSLCHRIADNPSLALHKEPLPVTALLLMRIVQAIEISETFSANSLVIEGPTPEDDQEALSVVFGVLLSVMQLDRALDGRVMEANWVCSLTRH